MDNTISSRRNRQQSHSPPPPPPPPLQQLQATVTRQVVVPNQNLTLNERRGMKRGRARVEYVESKNLMSIKNDVDVMKETLRVVHDGKFVVNCTLNSNVAGSVTFMFFAKEGEEDSQLTPMKKNLLPPVKVHFEQGPGQQLRQPSGTGIDFSMFEEAELLKESSTYVFPLAIKAETSPVIQAGSDTNPASASQNSQVTLAVFEKRKGEYLVRVIKQILWVDGKRYELREIFGMGNSVESGTDGDDTEKECVICLSEPRKTTTFPCLHMCMCSECAKKLRFQTNRCPICRERIEKLLEIKINDHPAE